MIVDLFWHSIQKFIAEMELFLFGDCLFVARTWQTDTRCSQLSILEMSIRHLWVWGHFSMWYTDWHPNLMLINCWSSLASSAQNICSYYQTSKATYGIHSLASIYSNHHLRPLWCHAGQRSGSNLVLKYTHSYTTWISPSEAENEASALWDHRWAYVWFVSTPIFDFEVLIDFSNWWIPYYS